MTELLNGLGSLSMTSHYFLFQGLVDHRLVVLCSNGEMLLFIFGVSFCKIVPIFHSDLGAFSVKIKHLKNYYFSFNASMLRSVCVTRVYCTYARIIV